MLCDADPSVSFMTFTGRRLNVGSGEGDPATRCPCAFRSLKHDEEGDKQTFPVTKENVAFRKVTDVRANLRTTDL